MFCTLLSSLAPETGLSGVIFGSVGLLVGVANTPGIQVGLALYALIGPACLYELLIKGVLSSPSKTQTGIEIL